MGHIGPMGPIGPMGSMAPDGARLAPMGVSRPWTHPPMLFVQLLYLKTNKNVHKNDEYLVEMNSVIKCLIRNLRNAPATKLNLIFWCDVAGEDMLTTLGSGKARWLSVLSPMEKLLNSYVVMCLLRGPFITL